MFEYFPGNYVWNLAVVAALNSGGTIDEVDRACRPLKDAAAAGTDAGTGDFLRVWTELTDSLVAQGEVAEKAGHRRTAGQFFARATNYLVNAERMQGAHSAERLATYQRCLDLLQRSFALNDPLTTRVEIPYEETSLPAYFTRAPAADQAPAPVMILWNGLDSTKEHQYLSGFSHELAERGISTLMVDCPGGGEALRMQNLTARIDTEAWATACVDYLETRDDVRADRIGLAGWSLGGYYAPRAAAFEKRLALVVAWGANHDWGAVQHARLQREGEHPVPHYWEHVLWVWGHTDIDEFIDFADGVNLDGVVEQITVPFLICHGEHDRQIPVRYARRSYEQAVNSPKRELRIFTREEGGAEHIGLDHLPHVSSYIADWVTDTFAGLDTTR
ncbi:prolyl oligopeptidase family protein [Actinocorallia herbida]|uniref:Prolyl oligopeptidase family protein n=1 Tax=Actinocorallia herbida TaxID=58109 RepID=A0A3N1D3F2_9ACTN|nr:prolyl oligopeptidase family serine peptidase [Actinocorallia herbida]ROO88051.1 prolyl oligopeptidase family protein [Actinocorallia herbida]